MTKEYVTKLIKDYTSSTGVIFSCIKSAYKEMINMTPEDLDAIGIENFHIITQICMHKLPGRYVDEINNKKLLFEVIVESDNYITIKLVK